MTQKYYHAHPYSSTFGGLLRDIVLTERQFELLRSHPEFVEGNFVRCDLGPHTSALDIPTFERWSPHIAFDTSGFKLEDRIDLLKVGKETFGREYNEEQYWKDGDVNAPDVSSGENIPKIAGLIGGRYIDSKLTFGGRYHGTSELLDRLKTRIQDVIDALNGRSIEFIFFRTHGAESLVSLHFPDSFPFYDIAFFYSLGNFREANIANVLSKSRR